MGRSRFCKHSLMYISLFVGVSVALKTKEGKYDDPIAVKTRLGWTVCGGWKAEKMQGVGQCSFHVCVNPEKSDENLHQIVKAYFALDSQGITKSENVLSSEDQRAHDLLKSGTYLRGNRYETGLLWRHDDFRLPDSREMALQRHLSLVKRLEKNPLLAEILHQKLSDYIRKGYARKLNDDELNQTFQRVWYLPVFPVMNSNKPGKVRLVWDAAAKSHGISLNSALLKGPDQLCSLFAILLQFREGRIGLTGDVREMFHQILIRDEDQQCQRFFWTDKDGKLSVYVMNVMTFGACCSPSSAQYVKNLNAERFAKEFPAATRVILKLHYVDDMLLSTNSEEAAIRLAKDVQYIHSQGGFEIRNWISNSRYVLTTLGQDSTDDKDLDLATELATEKVLGMWWCTQKDVFTYKVGWNRYDHALLKGLRRPTKREVLRVLMTIFDPLGLIAHYLMHLKVLLQDIWRSGIEWDEKINEELYDKWRMWLTVLPQVELVMIPRCYQSLTPPINRIDSSTSLIQPLEPCDPNQVLKIGCPIKIDSYFSRPKQSDVELHTFVDASENGMAAAVYIRFMHVGEIECTLVAAKTKVAPLKHQSIPRLELQAAVIGSRLARTVQETLSIPVHRQIFWSDSRDVLCWINSDHRKYTQFVACRVSEILETTETNEWRWVPSKSNVADDGTKWTRLPDLTSRARWFSGPEFLKMQEAKWPQSSVKVNPTATELRHRLSFHVMMPSPIVDVTNFSCWKRLIHLVARVQRFPANCRRKLKHEQILTETLSMEEQRGAEDYLVRLAQREAFPEEINLLRNSSHQQQESHNVLPKTSKLRQLTPWLDNRGIMRMRSRIAACAFATEDAKYPIILPREHHLTTLILKHYHHKYHHQNHETVINEIRQKYYVPRIRVNYRKVRNTCQRCKNETSLPHIPIMAELPAARLAAFSRPFTHVGVDYFGPMEVVVGRRVEKRWVMLATCMTIRAVHLEVVHSLTTDSCIMALRNCFARRGCPRKIYSDRGTNFIGANKKLKELYQEIDQVTIMREFVSSDTEWVFNPPSAPHMGGSWERLIRTVKNNLFAIRPSRRPTDEVFRNLLTEIENIINSRPLTHVPIDDDSAPALTPNHFLLGSSNGIKPLCFSNDSGAILRQNWRASQILANQFWRRWLSDYLPEITRRSKWFDHTRPITTGDVVVIADNKLPRNLWPLGKIIHTHISKDGQIRSATVRTAVGVYERPVSKLAVLDVHRDR
ncbi:uncharacterized protein LOC131432514 [Malaya genurostris]|uniref:uncharacterized protein LOC131432514 n=2 Tax=Malaya genurostris TaxID=325434 RepID=UPI0026F3FE21|nr:uncharacterized protein LOC131432514 [Malaya genurostris]